MEFDRLDDPKPMTAACAVRRGTLYVNVPVFLILFGGIALALVAMAFSLVAGCVVFVLGFSGAWLWWSYSIPQWRSWALRRGADPVELHARAVQAQLEWPKGSFFERTEIRRNGR